MKISRLKLFILEANEKGYAGGDESTWQTEADGSTTISYESHDFRLHDNFFGGEPYGGRQIIFFQNKPIWIMVYYGAVNPSFDHLNMVYSFLREALSAGTKADNYRGPNEYATGDFRYKNAWHGDINAYDGKENIYYKGEDVYWAKYLGGFVDQRKGV